MIDSLFHELIIQEKIVVYIDDILIFLKMIEKHKSIVKQVLQILANNKLSLNPRSVRCTLDSPSVIFR